LIGSWCVRHTAATSEQIDGGRVGRLLCDLQQSGFGAVLLHLRSMTSYLQRDVIRSLRCLLCLEQFLGVELTSEARLISRACAVLEFSGTGTQLLLNDVRFATPLSVLG